MRQAQHPRTASGAWVPGTVSPRSSSAAFQAALGALGTPVVVVAHEGRAAVADGGRATLGVTPAAGSLPLLGYAPPLRPGDLGDATFLADHGVSAAYVVGEMANAIASEALVEAAARAGLLGIFGAAGLSIARVTEALDRLSSSLPGLPWGVNLIHSPDDPRLEAALVDLLLARGVRFVSASAYLDLTLPLVKYRVTGIRRDANGAVVAPNRLMAKVSRAEVARRFLEPPPERFLSELVTSGDITAEQARLAASIPMADDLTAEAGSAGHTDNRPLVLLLPALQALRDEIVAEHRYATRVRVGAAGGIATPASVASAFAMGAAYVVTGSINQATREAGTSDAVRQLLAQALPSDVAMAPAADMFEMGVKVQVLTRGTLFAVRAARLYDLYRAHGSSAELPTAAREELEKKYFRSTLEEAWEGCRRFFAERDETQLRRAAEDPHHQLALLFRSYLGQASKWANAGVVDRRLDYQVWCGPAMGAFNEWARGSFLESWEERRAVVIAKNLLVGAAVLTRAAALRTQGIKLPAAAERFAPRAEAELDALLLDGPQPAEDDPVVAAREVVTASQPHDEPIAIVGMGAMFPEAANLAAFWRLLRTGRDAIGDVPAEHWSVDDYFDPDPAAPDKTYARRGAFLSPSVFDATEFGIPPAILEATDTSQLLGLVVARMAMEDAGYGEGRSWNRSRASVILGVTGTQELVISLGARLGHPKWKKALQDAGVDEDTAKDVVERIAQSYVSWQENSFPGLLGNVVAGRIANRLDLGGTNCVIDAACASSLAALHLAMLELRANRSDLVLTGGVDCLNDIFMHVCFSKTPALSPSGDVRPFSDQADGTLLGEGLGMVVLKRLSDAEREGDRVHAVIRSVGTSSDGRAKSIYAPLPSGQARALTAAYELASVRPRDITLVEAHGTGTKAGDAAEFEALRAVYREDADDPAWCTLGSVKSQIGHTKAAAGAAGLIKVALALHHKVLPPTLKLERPHPALKAETSPFAFTPVARPWISREGAPRRAGVSSFGFGGSNFHVVLEEHGSARPAPAWDGSIEVLALSADDVPQLVAQAQEILRLSGAERAAALASARAAFHSDKAHRLLAAVVADTSLDALLTPALDRLRSSPGVPFSLPDGVHYGAGPVAGKLAFLFPGQGAQHVDMLREMACIFPEMLDAVERDLHIARSVYPLPTFDDEERARREAHLTHTANAQPALAAVNRGLLDVLRRFSVAPDMVAGHSHGELVALHAAGVLDADALDAVSKLRGTLMAGNGGDRGTMLAVFALLADIETLIAEERLDVVLANRNAPGQGVLSGPRSAIQRAEEACRQRSISTSRLSVGAAFHGPLVAPAAKDLRAGLEAVTFGTARVSVLANSTAQPYPSAPALAKDLLAQQLALPVRFTDVVETLWSEGARAFVEVGPKSALTGMVRAILGTRQFTAVAVDAGSKRGGLFDFAQVLCRLAALGHAVTLDAWQRVPMPQHAPPPAQRKPRMALALSGVNYRAPVTPASPRRVETPVPAVAARSASSGIAPVDPTLLDILRAHQDSIRALQAMQEQTAHVHQVFLAGQQSAQESLQALLMGQGGLISPVASTRSTPRVPALSLAPPVPGGALPSPSPFAPHPVPHAAAVLAAASQPTLAAVDVAAVLFAVVSQATGYPEEALGLEMDLEADLGIDSIKRVEILSMLSKRIPGAPSVDPEKLGNLRTLGQVLAFTAPRAAAPAPTVEAADAFEEAAELADMGAGRPAPTPPLERAVVVPVRIPAASAVALPEGPILVMADRSGLAGAIVTRLAAAGCSARVISDAAEAAAETAVGGLILVAPDEQQWTAESEATLKSALRLARALGPALRRAERRNPFVAAISRRDGAFGLAAKMPSWNPLSGGLAGLAKTLRHEWPEVRCRAIDIVASWSLDDAARAIVEELATDGPVETGLGPSGRVTLALRPVAASPVENRLRRGDVVVVTGGARGVTADCALALAQRSAVTLVLLGRSQEPADEPEWLGVALSEAEIKHALLQHATDGPRPSPRAIGESCRAILAGREIRSSMKALEAAGVRAVYRSVDVRDEGALSAILGGVRSSLGAIRGIIHGAGVLRDRRIEDKSDDDLDQVLDTKLAGLRALLSATREDDLRIIGLFASVTGRFGRRGQSDYAVANQALASIAAVEGAQRPECRVVALDWGPWAGGMVTPALRKQFEREGVGLIPLAAGAQAFCQEMLSAPAGPAEVVVGCGVGATQPNEWALASAWTLDTATFPILSAHVLAGKAVLPLAMTIEWFAEAATRVSGRRIQGLDDIRVLRGITLGDEPEPVSVWVGPFEHLAEGLRFPLELRSTRGFVHVSATAVAGPALPRPEAMTPPEPLSAFSTPMRAVYAQQLFHGEVLHAIEGIDGIAKAGMTLRLRTHPTSERLLPGPGRPWTIDPLALDGVFQALIVWCRAHVGAPSLPSGIASLRLLAPFKAASLRTVVKIRAIDKGLVTCDVDLHGASGELFVRMKGVACTVSKSLDRAFGVDPAAAPAVVPSA